MVSRDSAHGPNEWDLVRTEFLRYEEHPRYFRFNVVAADNFTFDLCDSKFAASMAVYRRNRSNNATSPGIDCNPRHPISCPPDMPHHPSLISLATLAYSTRPQ